VRTEALGVVDGGAHVRGCDRLRPRPVGGEERFVRADVDEAGNTPRRGRDRAPGGAREDPLGSAGSGEAVEEIGLGFGGREGPEAVGVDDPLGELTEIRTRQASVEFGLAEEDDLEKFRRLGLEIGEEADVLEGGAWCPLGLVDEQDGGSSPACVEEQEILERRRVGTRDETFRAAELAGETAPELGGSDVGMGKVGRHVLAAEGAEEAAAEERLAEPDLAGDLDESRAEPQTEEHDVERLLVGRRRKEAGGVGRESEGFVVETEVAKIHRSGGDQGRGRSPWRAMVRRSARA